MGLFRDMIRGAIVGATPGNIPRLVSDAKAVLNRKKTQTEFAELVASLKVAAAEIELERKKP